VAGVTFTDVGKVYPDGTRAVNDMDLEIDEGEFMVLVGPSGCGKTTALRMVAGLENISEGAIKIGERVVNHVPARDRDIAMVFQSYALYPHLLEAARIDGASELRIFLRVILPLGLPAIASLAIFLWVWNDLLVALTFGRDTQVITVAIFSQMRQFSANIELIAPAAFVSLAIPLVVFFAFQRYFVQGLLAGSVK